MEAVVDHIKNMQSYFSEGETLSLAFRRKNLQKLKNGLYQYEHEIYEALYVDLKKNREEAWVTEIGFVKSEINYAI